MLVQVVALLSLGVLCSSAPTRGTRHSPQEERSRALVESIVRELLQDIQKLNLNAVPRVVAVNATVERCMQSHLKTFVLTLVALDRPSKLIARKLSLVDSHIPSKNLDEECQTAQVTKEVFLETLDRFLRLLFEKILST